MREKWETILVVQYTTPHGYNTERQWSKKKSLKHALVADNNDFDDPLRLLNLIRLKERERSITVNFGMAVYSGPKSSRHLSTS